MSALTGRSSAEPGGVSLELLEALSVSEVGQTSFQLSWTAPAGSFDSFLVELKDLAGFNEIASVSVPGDVRHTAIADLSPGTLYEITLHGTDQENRSHILKAIANTGILSLVSVVILQPSPFLNLLFVLLAYILSVSFNLPSPHSAAMF